MAKLNNGSSSGDLILNDCPIRTDKDDELGLENIVNEIFQTITNSILTPLTIAIVAEYGGCKTSALNLLRNKLEGDDKNLLIDFEPLLEGAVEIPDIIKLFYLKLHTALQGNKMLAPIIKKCLKSFALLVSSKITAEFGIPGAGKIGIECDPIENIEKTLKLWEQNKPKPFSEQTKEIGNKLKQQGYRLFVFMDEIDRLPAKYILNFLLFARIIENFDNLVCVVAIDYKSVINKLIHEGQLGQSSYEKAKIYIDKLFQTTRYIHVNDEKKFSYAISCLRKIDTEKVLLSVIDSAEYDVREQLQKITEYLATPRQIKKWLISIKINMPVIKYSPAKLALIGYLAAIVKHPIVLDNLSKHVMNILQNKYINGYKHFIKEKFDIELNEDRWDNIALILSGVAISAIKKNGNLKKNIRSSNANSNT